jgi:hypothetical protein
MPRWRTPHGWGGFGVASAGEGVEVDIVRIDQVVSSDKPISLLKVDIEGADAWALMGSEQLFRAKVVHEVCYEQNKPRMRQLGIPLPRMGLRLVSWSSGQQSNMSKPIDRWEVCSAAGFSLQIR